MSKVLYYSNYCEHSKKVLSIISRSNLKNEMYFICVDKRVKKNGAVYVILENGEEILLPPTIVRVPALLLLDRGHQVLFGEDIINMIKPQIQERENKATNFNGEPLAFSLNSMGGGGYGVASDNYSFLDQNSEELSAKGDGGMRQIHHYASITHMDKIETPPDTYRPDKIGEVSMDKLRRDRENSIKK